LVDFRSPGFSALWLCQFPPLPSMSQSVISTAPKAALGKGITARSLARIDAIIKAAGIDRAEAASVGDLFDVDFSFWAVGHLEGHCQHFKPSNPLSSGPRAFSR
jgi:hypothetical protein